MCAQMFDSMELKLTQMDSNELKLSPDLNFSQFARSSLGAMK